MDPLYELVLPIWFAPVIIVVMLWTLFWKGLSMWHAARNKDSTWFIILFIFNNVGILDIIYLFGVLNIKSDKLFK